MTSAAIIVLLGLVPNTLTFQFSQGNFSYYWSPYNGTTPEDSVEGGKEFENSTFYIGLVQLKLINEVFAGMIIPKTQTARITSLGITREVRNDPFTTISILRSKHVKAFQWIETESQNLSLVMKDYHVVGGGKVLGQDLYIGRVFVDGGYVLGKIFPHRFIYQGLYVPLKRVFAQFMAYSVLVFDCNTNC